MGATGVEDWAAFLRLVILAGVWGWAIPNGVAAAAIPMPAKTSVVSVPDPTFRICAARQGMLMDISNATRPRISTEIKKPDIGVERYYNANVTLCRIYQACRDPAGRVRVRSRGGSRCGLKHFGEIPDDEFQTSSRMDKDLLFFGESDSAPLSRSHMPHFMHDFLPLLPAHDTVVRGAQGEDPGLSAEFLDFNNQTVVLERNTTENGLDPILIFEDRFRRRSHSSEWIREFLQVLGADSIVLNTTSDSITCFNSIITASYKHRPQVSISHLLNQNSHIFSDNRLERMRTKDSCQCDRKVVIINRHDSSKARTIANLNELEKKIASTRVCGKMFAVETVYFDSENFSSQVGTMQSADIIVSIHGAELSNSIFLRTGSFLLEILPFAYYPKRFSRFSEALALDHLQEIAKPDGRSVSSCLKKLMRSTNDTTLLGNYHRLLNRFQEAATETRNLTKRFGFNILDSDLNFEVPNQRVCMRSQVLQVDANSIANKIREREKKFCRCTK
uniref:Glycosyltransferase 61 catalytic domain-containing protein n=1 Tax=Compsopogon caeruleus TaxID=31354 RepID=A0A6T6ACZ9_9RHOD|mmetsp:Transcript_10286/g.20729  ORF Transcript_10286/g.20729 Transcript_10286/m.20729 type:complete len:503 (+) Transcript_10286:532-2040(+)